MTLATRRGGVLEIGNSSIGTTPGESKSGKSDIKALMHSIFMISAFVSLFPLGTLLLRLGNPVRWYLINQVVAFGLAFSGTVMGIVASTLYNRVSNNCRYAARNPLTCLSQKVSAIPIRSSGSLSLCSSLPNICWAICIIVLSRRHNRRRRWHQCSMSFCLRIQFQYRH